MLLEILGDYLTEVEAAFRSLKDCHFEKYREEILTHKESISASAFDFPMAIFLK